MPERCKSKDSLDGMQCGLPEGHTCKHGNGIGHRSWTDEQAQTAIGTKPKAWTHSICDECWKENNPSRIPVRALTGMKKEQCCYCGKLHNSGIYTREDETEVLCKGKTGIHQEKE